MPFTNYTDLQAAVLAFNWARDAGNVADFINLAHTEINLTLRTTFMQRTDDVSISAQRVAAPADMAAPVRFWIDADYDNPLTPQPPDRIAALKAQYSSGKPAWFGIEGEDDDLEYFTFAPSPGATYTGKLLYVRRLPFFASGGATNVVLNRYPNLYLYGALAEAARFSDDDARLVKYAGLFAGMLERINMRTQADALGGGALQMVNPYAI